MSLLYPGYGTPCPYVKVSSSGDGANAMPVRLSHNIPLRASLFARASTLGSVSRLPICAATYKNNPKVFV
jgi:hypothetical protein